VLSTITNRMALKNTVACNEAGKVKLKGSQRIRRENFMMKPTPKSNQCSSKEGGGSTRSTKNVDASASRSSFSPSKRRKTSMFGFFLLAGASLVNILFYVSFRSQGSSVGLKKK
jgi:hypothetical protein